jgi:hypothetical protein
VVLLNLGRRGVGIFYSGGAEIATDSQSAGRVISNHYPDSIGVSIGKATALVAFIRS